MTVWLTSDEFAILLERDIRLIRIARMLRGKGLWDMAIEIKGLKGKALLARKNLDDLGQSYDAFNVAAPAHKAEVDALAEQVSEMQSDLEFAANTMGNGGNSQEQTTEKPIAKGVSAASDNQNTETSQITSADITGFTAPLKVVSGS